MEQTAANIEVTSPQRPLLPYLPSWVDRLTAWVQRRPGPVWLYYLAAMALFYAAYLLVHWWESGYPLISSQIPLLTIATAFYYLGVIHYLDNIARSAMARFRPAIKAPPQRVMELEYRLTTMPARMVWLMTLLGALEASLVMAAIGSHLLAYPGVVFFASAPAAILEGAMVLLLGVIFFVSVYHTVHQLHTVSMIYTELAEVDLFNQAPLHAFARLAAYTAIAWILPGYFWITARLQAAAFGVALSFLVIATILGVLTFIWPLQGIHRLLAAKKDQLQGEANRRLEKSLRLFAQTLDKELDKEDVASMQAISAAISTAEQERRIVATIPTWPWQPDLLRGAATAFFLPLIIWAATRILERFFGP
jgi:hypothetical protein